MANHQVTTFYLDHSFDTCFKETVLEALQFCKQELQDHHVVRIELHHIMQFKLWFYKDKHRSFISNEILPLAQMVFGDRVILDNSELKQKIRANIDKKQ